jgi:hypothetical protein
MVCLPATQFGCGFSITCGVKFVLFLNLALNVAIVALTVGHMIFFIDSMMVADYPLEMTMLGFCLAGVPIIILGFNGVVYRNEAQIRLYLYYMWILMAVLIFLVFKEFVFSSACDSIPGLKGGQGSAWACGMARYIHLAATIVSLSIICYFQHVVYSYCEDLSECGGGPDLRDLVLNKPTYSKMHQPSAYCSIEGMAEIADSGELWESSILGGSVYDKAAMTGLGGGQRLFHGRYHEMSYPPHGSSIA